MRSKFCASIALGVLICWAGVQATDYPLTLGAAAQVTKGATTVTTTFTIHVDREMNETFRSRVMDALKFGGYPKFLSALRSLPPIGTISFEARTVEIRYAREEPREKGSRLVLVADRPLFFLGDPCESSSRLRADDGRDNARRAGRGHRHHDGRGAREANTRGRPRRR